ncbi:hypothetical protein U1700_13095 [Sphingomonas sp. RB1R13]
MRILTLLSLVSAALAPASARMPTQSQGPPFHSLTSEFTRFYDETVAMPEDQRVKLFERRFDVLFPGFYEPMDGQTQEQFDQTVEAAIKGFGEVRPKYRRAQREFPAVYAAGIVHFHRTFPDFRMTMPVWLVHSLGRMDGGTRNIRGVNTLIFGADVIAHYHNGRDIGPFLDHEMFHVENSRWFPDCEPDMTVWCALWQEGLATYVSGTMNKTHDDAMLMLTTPGPIRPAVDHDWMGALCLLKDDLARSDRPTYAMYFTGGGSKHPYPARFGYYLGYRVMERLGKRYSLAQLDHMDHARALAVLMPEIDAMVEEAGGCNSRDRWQLYTLLSRMFWITSHP